MYTNQALIFWYLSLYVFIFLFYLSYNKEHPLKDRQASSYVKRKLVLILPLVFVSVLMGVSLAIMWRVI